MILQRIIPSHHPARCEHAEKGRENPTLRSFEVRSRPPTDWYRRLPCLYRSTVSLDRSPRDSKVQNWTQILPTSPQGVGKGPKMVDLSKLDFPYEPTAVLCREFKGGFRPIYRIEQRPSDPRVATGGPRRPARGEARPGARCRGDGVGRLRDLGCFLWYWVGQKWVYMDTKTSQLNTIMCEARRVCGYISSVDSNTSNPTHSTQL